jgi:iron complex outermembrane recepter protein
MKINLIKRSLLVALSTTSLIGLSAPAFAQDTAAANAPVEDSGEIIVSARRRNESIQDTPIAITAINSAQLESKGAVNIGDLMGTAPNLVITNQNSGGAAANLSIRGLTYADVEKSQEPTVGVVVDGVFIGTSTGQFFDFFDIDQVEVLRGPQGTLFGRNTIGGVVNIKRTRPTGEFGGKAEISYGSYGALATRAVLNVPLIDHQLALKFFDFHNENKGYYRDGITGERRGGNNNENFGASVLVAPDGSNFDAVLTVEKQVQKFDVVVSSLSGTGEAFCNQATIDYIVGLSGGPAGSVQAASAAECGRNNREDLYTVFGSPAVSNYSAPAVTLEMNYNLGGIKLTSVSGYRNSEENQTQDFDGARTDLYYTRRIQDYAQWSQELRAAGKIGSSFDYVVGGYWFKSDYSLTQYTRFFGQSPNIDPIVVDKAPQLVQGATRSLAIFGDFNWAFADKLRLSFGGRFTRDKKSLSNAYGGVLLGQGQGTFKKFTPKIGLDYRPNSDTMIYASWSRGFRSGGFSPRAGTAITAGVAYEPETVDSYEIGTKLDLFDRKLQFNVAAFYSKYDKLQQNTTIPGGPTGNQTITSNVGSADIKGIEMDFTARPAEGLRFNGSLGLLKSKFKGFIVGNTTPAGALRQFDYSGNDMIYSPKVNASLSADYTLPTSFGKIMTNIGYRYVGAYDQQISAASLTIPATGNVIVNGNDPRVRTDAQHIVDISVAAKFNIGETEAKLTLFGRNMLDNRGPTHGFTFGLGAFGTAREPRTFGASLGVKF